MDSSLGEQVERDGGGVAKVQTLATEQRDIEHSLEFSCFFSVSCGGRGHDSQAFFPEILFP